MRIHPHDVDEEGVEASILSKGEAFGEYALVTGLPPIARAEAVDDTVLWEIHKDDFNEVVAVSPGLQSKLDHLTRHVQEPSPAGGLDPKKSSAWLQAASHNLESEVGKPTEAEIIHASHSQKRSGSNVALAIWLGIALDGIP